LAREATLEQIKNIIQNIKRDNLNYKGKLVEIETFIHGALCVAYSGRCFMSQYHNRLSANRGQCLQECRRKYKIIDIEDPRREFIIDRNYVLSPKDLCTLPIIDRLIDAGINVFKIEGRAKSPEYVYTTTKVYREAINLIEKKKFTLEEKTRLLKELDNVFNRGFTDNFYLGTPTNDSWSKFYGSIAKEKKIKLGRITNYYPKAKVASAIIEENRTLKKNDTIAIIGPTTGFYKDVIKELRFNDKIIDEAKQGQEISFKVGASGIL
jgi:putative protease